MIGKAIVFLIALWICVGKGHSSEEAGAVTLNENSLGDYGDLPYNCTGNPQGVICQIGSSMVACDIMVSPSDLSGGNQTSLSCFVYHNSKMIGTGGIAHYDELDLTVAGVCSFSNLFNGFVCYKYNEPQIIDGKIQVCSSLSSDTEFGHVDTPLSCTLW